MLFANLISLGLAHLIAITLASPMPSSHAFNKLSFLPTKVVWHATDAHSLDSSLDSTSATATVAKNITACTDIIYDHVSPARTSVVRDDCADLAEQVKSTPGFWKVYRWAHHAGDVFEPLVSIGTCEFGVRRRDAPMSANSSMSDVVL